MGTTENLTRAFSDTRVCLCERIIVKNGLYFSSSPSLPGAYSHNLQARRGIISLSPIAASPPPPVPPPKRKFRSQWSKGDGPGEYGGPPLDFKIRDSWGGKIEEDPFSGKGGFIWNKDWKRKLRAEEVRIEDEKRQKEEKVKNELRKKGLIKDEPKDSGFLSIGRALSLDSMDVDLSQELMRPSKSSLQRQVEEARRASYFQGDEAFQAEANEERPSGGGGGPQWRYAPTRKEEKRWARSKKAGAGGGGMGSLLQEAKEDRALVAERERQQYETLKTRLMLYTAGMNGVGCAATWLYYSPAVSLSFLMGSVGSIAYVRMLSGSMDSLGKMGVENVAKSAIGQPRLLIPVVLMMTYNRWNEILVPGYNAIPLEVIPMLLGFFTYKAATLVQTFETLLPQENVSSKAGPPSSPSP